MRIPALTLLYCSVAASLAPPLPAQTFEASVPPGDNFNTAEFRLWHPEGVETLQGILVLVPGSNGDGRGEALLEAVNILADESGHPELSQAPFLLWSMPAGGQFNYEIAGSKDMAVLFFDELIPLRLPDASPDEDVPLVLRSLDRDSGFIADPKSQAIVPAAQAPQTTYPTSWLPTETLARAWQRLVGGGS